MNICLVCAWYEVGMRHYSFTVIKNLHVSLKNSDYKFKVLLVLRKEKEEYPELNELKGVDLEVLVIKNPLINILSKIFPLVLDVYVNKVSKSFGADLLYILYEGVFFKYTGLLKKKQKILYTLHDLIPHEKGIMSLKEKWLSNLEDKRRKHLLIESNYVITNSHHQFVELSATAANKVFFCSMPTLINEHISQGSLSIKELIAGDYILFFGRIDKYKGLDNLIDSHIKSNLKTKLVIAGSGKFWFKIPQNENIIVINRYIDDAELKTLFTKARLAVMPYISITQTSLISIPFYFKCAVILSDISEFKELSDQCGSLTCNFKNAADYKNKVQSIYNDDVLRSNVITNQLEYYNHNYDPQNFAKNMRNVFDAIRNN